MQRKKTAFRIPLFWGLHAEPVPLLQRLLPALPYLVFVLAYTAVSYARYAENPQDKLIPIPPRIVAKVVSMSYAAEAVAEDANPVMAVVVGLTSSQIVTDTVASMRRVAIGLGCASIFGLMTGINMALFRGLQALFTSFLTFISIIPSLLLLPVLLIYFGVEELSKVLIIFIGTSFLIGRDVDLSVQKMVPRAQIVKTLTLGASTLQVVYLTVLPQILPRWIDSTRLAFGPGLLFLIAAEMIASSEGLGYRTSVMARYLAMDGIIPYVLWVTLVILVFDQSVKRFISWQFPWYATAVVK